MLPDWLNIVAQANNSTNVRRIFSWLVPLTIYATAIATLDYYYGYELITLSAGFHTLLGLVLGTLLVFRTNTAYDRWWEGRKLWGQLVNDTRNLAIKIQTCVQAEPREKMHVAKQLSAFAVGLKEHLRDGAKLRDLPAFADATEDPANVPQYIATTIYDRIERWRRAEQLGGFELLFLDPHAAALMNICGGCERIKKTPIAGTYRTFIRQSIALYLVTLPWGIVDLMHWWLVVVVPVVAYFMIGIEVIAEDIEEPFGRDNDDLPLDAICEVIDRSVNEIVVG
jgi:putative membrane protein